MASAEFNGFEAVKAKLGGMLAAKAQALKAAGLAILTAAQKSITSGGAGWPAWSPNYKPKRAHQMLWDYGTLLRSLTLGDQNNVFREEGDDTVIVGSAVAYARAQNQGYGHLPARPYLFVDDDRAKLAQQAFIAQLNRGAK
jgi:phage gpG-like protein